MDIKKEEIRDFAISVLGLTILSSIFDLAFAVYYFFAYSISIASKIIAQKACAKKFDLDAKYSFDYSYFIISAAISLLTLGAIIFPILGFSKPSQKSIRRIGKSYSSITFNESGWIALIGIISSASMVVLSLVFYDFMPEFFGKMIPINSLIMIFSLLPFKKFDGSSIIWWNRFLWIACLLSALLLAFFAHFKVNPIVSILFIAIAFIASFIFWEKNA